MNAIERIHLIKTEAKRLGFLSCGISKAEFLEEEAPRLEKWLKQDMHGEMQYMENHFDKRLDPTKLVEGSKSVISLLLNYFPSETQVHGRAFVDSAPVLDKAWAAKSGLGWIGKHSNLLTQQVGSFYFIAELIVDLELEYDTPVTDHCGTCTACIDACPTEAIVAPYVVDGSKCISYLTIELKNEIPNEFQGKLDEWMFGCDVCQDVCPWNRFSKPHNEPLFHPKPELLSFTQKDWEEITEDVFRKVFKKSAVKRTKYAGLKRNIDFLKK